MEFRGPAARISLLDHHCVPIFYWKEMVVKSKPFLLVGPSEACERTIN